MSKVSELDKLYKAEKNARISLETNLQEMSSFLDETQYNFIPLKVRESLERSLRLSQSFNKNRDVVTPPNVTQSELDDMPSPKEGKENIYCVKECFIKNRTYDKVVIFCFRKAVL